MKSQESIAIFDSGVGGLTVANCLKKRLPHEHLIYLADTASSPFGTKSPIELEAIIKQNLQFLALQPIKLLLIACHTACSLGSSIYSSLPIKTLGITPSTLELLTSKNFPGPVLILGTQRTINSLIYQEYCQRHLPHLETYYLQGSILERMIEEKKANHYEIENAIRELLKPVVHLKIKCLFLACTHFPLYTAYFQKILPEAIIIDPAEYFVDQVENVLLTHQLLSNTPSSQEDLYFTTRDIETFQDKAYFYFKDLFNQKKHSFNSVCDKICL